MSDFYRVPQPERPIPPEQQRPPQFSDEEATAYLRARDEIAATDSEAWPGGWNDLPAKKIVEGVTQDGLLVTVYDRRGLAYSSATELQVALTHRCSVRTGNIADLAEATPLSIQTVSQLEIEEEPDPDNGPQYEGRHSHGGGMTPLYRTGVPSLIYAEVGEITMPLPPGSLFRKLRGPDPALELPSVGDRLLFPISEDGRPFDPRPV